MEERMSATTLSPASVRAALDGHPAGDVAVLTPDDDAYEAARHIEPGGVDWRPAAIVRPADAAGVARTVGFARDAGAELAVRAGGHSALGLGRGPGALTLDLRGLDSIELDTDGRTAWAGGGLTAGAYSQAVGAHGLVTPFGDTASVGIGGITLAGGVGLLARSRGLTIDSLVGAEVVTADGEIVVADADHEPDLFWGLRGGGGNFGVVTRFRYRLHELPTVVGGLLLLPATPESVAGVVAEAEAAPRELTVIATVMVAPPMPFVPAEWHGRLVTMANVCWSGDPDAADSALAPLRDVAARAGGAILDMIRPGTYAGLLEPGPEGSIVATAGGFFADDLDAAAAAHLLGELESSEAMMRAVQLRVLGGAVGDVPSDATAFAHRDVRLGGYVMAAGPSAEAVEGYKPWVAALADRLRQRDGAYAGFVGDGNPELAPVVYPGATWDRLAAVKRAYDPQNLFRGNLNVPPG
jgi:FAD/FMN-containing dehydrogenase